MYQDLFKEYLMNLEDKITPNRRQQWTDSQYGRYGKYLMINGDIPKNLTIARFETLRKDVDSFMVSEMGMKKSIALPHKNASRHGDFSNYYNKQEEELVYGMWKNTFDDGLYERYEGLKLSS